MNNFIQINGISNTVKAAADAYFDTYGTALLLAFPEDIGIQSHASLHSQAYAKLHLNNWTF